VRDHLLKDEEPHFAMSGVSAKSIESTDGTRRVIKEGSGRGGERTCFGTEIANESTGRRAGLLGARRSNKQTDGRKDKQ